MPLSLDEINALTAEMDQEAKAIKEEIIKLCWYMRGGMSLTEAHDLTLTERQLITDLIKSNLEITKETGFHFFSKTVIYSVWYNFLIS